MSTDLTCQSCKYFYRHCTKQARTYSPTAFGHCIHPRVKIRRIDTPACEKFSPRERDT